MQMTRDYMAETQQKLKEQGDALSTSNKHLTDSIQYASRIQRALFSANTLYRFSFANSFIFLKPKDVVSGDAPWFYQCKNVSFAAAIDCTGHGVPGAMLTVLAISLLNEIMTTQKYDSPREILLELDQLIHSYLRSGQSSKNKSRDGLDISLICYNSDTNEMKFVGVHHKLYLWQNNQLQKIKGSHYNMGDANIECADAIVEHSFKINKGDRAYLFSDGFPDQFGGADNFKLMVGNFYKLIAKTANFKSIDDQKAEISSFFNDWKGENVQTDDVLVVGIEF